MDTAGTNPITTVRRGRRHRRSQGAPRPRATRPASATGQVEASDGAGRGSHVITRAPGGGGHKQAESWCGRGRIVALRFEYWGEIRGAFYQSVLWISRGCFADIIRTENTSSIKPSPRAKGFEEFQKNRYSSLAGVFQFSFLIGCHCHHRPLAVEKRPQKFWMKQRVWPCTTLHVHVQQSD